MIDGEPDKIIIVEGKTDKQQLEKNYYRRSNHHLYTRYTWSRTF